MVAYKVPNTRSKTYTGHLFDSIFSLVDKAEHDSDDEIMLERRLRTGPLSVQEVLDRVELKRREDSKLFSPARVTEEGNRS